MRYAIGLDVGITSVGYSVVALDSQDMPFRIEKLGSRIFEIAEQQKTGASLAAPRREARSMRRTIRRHRFRMERIRGLIVSGGILTKEELGDLYNGKQADIYELRTRALDQAVTSREFAKILIHLAQRRGFRSNRKAVSAGGEDGKLLSAVNENLRLCRERGYRSVGEMMFKDEKFSEYKRNKGDSYLNTVSRESVEAEAKMIFAAQRGFGALFASEKIEEKYLSILLSQRSFAEGPGSGPYSGNQIEKMIGFCTFEEKEYRAAKATYSFQVFSLWQHINHLRIQHDGEIRSLTDVERREIFNRMHQQSTVTYETLRKWLNLGEGDLFIGISYNKKTVSEAEKAKKFNDLEIYHKIRRCIPKEFDFGSFSVEQMDAIGEALSKNYPDEEILRCLREADIPEAVCAELLKLPNFSKYGHLSVKACRKIIPFLEDGMTYDRACEAAGYDFRNSEENPQTFLPPVPQDDVSITSPVVRRAVSQTIKVINAIIRERTESPVYINIELARELARNKFDRDTIKSEQEKNAKANESAMEQLKEKFPNSNPGGLDLVKYKLWQQQDGRCLYSLKPIAIEKLLEPGYVDVDHIVPYSKCFDDRMANKVLVLSSENRQKGNRLPLEYLTGKRRDDFIVFIQGQDSLPASKKRRLLMEHIGDEREWKNRNLVDTQYACSFLSQYIGKHLLFSEFCTKRKRHVTCVNGAVTAYVRKRWGIQKIREDGDLHHAIDATVIACITQGMIQKLTNYAKYTECFYAEDCIPVDEETGEVISDFPKFPEPWDGFRKELDIRTEGDTANMRKQLMLWNPPNYEDVDLEKLNAPFVSRMSNHKVTGAAHQDTARSGKYYSSGIVVSKVDLTELKLKNGEIENYYNPESDRLLYQALKERLIQNEGDAKKAFAEPFYKPRSDGSRGPLVKKVKRAEKVSQAVLIQNGTAVANNDSMLRCDVFYVEGDGYYLVPVYVSDTVKKELPFLACMAGKKPWKPMRAEDFCFSLYQNDLIRVYKKDAINMSVVSKKSTLDGKISKSGENGVFAYYCGTNIANATMKIISNDNTYQVESLGVKTLLKIEKYEVDVLGNIREASFRPRETFRGKKS